jgi:7 transmembrane receptor (rhodopsin family)
MRSSINHLLIGLACSDLLVLITAIIFSGLPTVYPYTGRMISYNFYVMPFLLFVAFPLAIIAQTTSIYMTLFVSLERYIAVCYPLKARSLCTKKHAKMCIIIIAIFSLVYNAIKFFEIQLVEGEDPDYGTFYCARANSLRRNPVYINVYIHWMYLIVINVIPLSAITYFNLQIFIRVKKVNKMRYQLTQREMQDIKLTSMLFCVVVVFLICNAPAVLINIYESLLTKLMIDDRLVKISNFLITLSSSVNFIIYVVLVKKFRLVFVDQMKSILLCSVAPQKPIPYDRRLSRLDSMRYSVRESETLVTSLC